MTAHAACPDASGPIPLPRAVLFDLDGTLSDSLPGIAWSLNAGRADLGHEPVTEECVRGWLGDGAARLAARSLGIDDLHDPRVRELTGVYLGHNERGAAARTRLYPGTREILAALRGRGVRLALTTNKPRTATAILLREIDFGTGFDAVVTPEDAGAHKPDPRFIDAALRALGVAAGESIVVGDGVPDILAAHAAGVRSVALLGGYGDPQALVAAGPTWTARDVADVRRRMGV